MDSARCVCKVLGPAMCPIHGRANADPVVPWAPTFNDRKWLRTLRIDPEDAADIQQTRQADEDRFRRD